MTEGTDWVMEVVSQRLSEIQEICKNEGINLVAVATREGLDSGANVLAVGPAKELIRMSKAFVDKVRFEKAKDSRFSIFAEGGLSRRADEVLENLVENEKHFSYAERAFEVVGVSEPGHFLAVGTTAWLERILPEGDYMVRGVSGTHGGIVSQIVNPRDLKEIKKKTERGRGNERV